VITDALYRAFREHGLEVRYVFTIDDYDPMDSQSMKQQAGMAEHMGKPFFKIPSPDPAKDFARFHAERFLSTFEHVGIHPQEIHWLRDLYGSGTLDHEIELVLRSADAVRRVYAEVSNVQKDPDWLPVWVICENCGRIGTTHATDFDGTTVAYECRKDYVAWAEGCGHRGRIAPFKGNAKLPWNLQWCAMWDHFDVTYEEGGKDLLTAGGSRDRANELYRAIWEREPPAGLVHEFFTIGGKKMATSRGLGASAVELVELYPGEVVRFLLFERGRMVDEYLSVPDYYGPMLTVDALALASVVVDLRVTQLVNGVRGVHAVLRHDANQKVLNAGARLNPGTGLR